MADLDYNRLPSDPEALYAVLEAEQPLNAEDYPRGSDMALLAPTWGSEQDGIVWICMVPAERRAYKMLLRYSDVADLQKVVNILLNRPDLLPQPGKTGKPGNRP